MCQVSDEVKETQNGKQAFKIVAASEAAAVAGVVAGGDFLLAVDSTPVNNSAHAMAMLSAGKPGRKMQLSLLDSDGQQRSVSVLPDMQDRTKYTEAVGLGVEVQV